MTNELVEDYLKDPTYEERIVAFCDVLGWRSQIAKAGDDPEKIGALRRQILLIGRMVSHVKPTTGLRFSSFSDNIVLSGPTDETSFVMIMMMLADYHASSAMLGFLTRGGVTVGEICHDSQVVFGPALNRAFEIESVEANYPRIVFDRNKFRHSNEKATRLITEEDCIFLNPFSVENFDIMAQLEPGPDSEFWDKAGLPKFAPRPSSSFEALQKCLEGIKPILRSPLADKDYERVAWLYDRLAKQLGVPPSSSYPRVKG